MYVGICKYYPILYEGHEHAWILVFMGGEENVPRTIRYQGDSVLGTYLLDWF